MDTLRKNILANYIGKGWSVASVYLFVPVNLHFLGIEAYGLVGFNAMLLGVLVFADMGLSATLSREMALLSGSSENDEKMCRFVRSIEMVYLGISVLLAILVVLLARPIAHHWLNTSALPIPSVERSIRLMGLSIIFQFPARMYIGGLLGLRRQVLANAIQVVMGIVRSGGAVLVLWLIAPTIEAFFLWQILSSVLLLLLCQQSLWASLPMKFFSVRPSLSALKGVVRYSIGMAIISFTSMILMQIDKITISKMLSLEALGYYALASALGQVPSLLSAPMATSIFPHLTQLMAAGKEIELARVYHRANQTIAAIVFPVGCTLALFSRDVLLFWTRSSQAADNTHLVASLLVVGSIALSIQAIPFQLALAAGWTRLTIYLGSCAIVFIVPLYIFLIHRYGTIGAGISWIVLNSTIAIAFIFFLHRRLLKGHAARWYLCDMAPSFLIALPFAILARLYVTPEMSVAAAIVSVGLIVAASCSVCLALTARRPWCLRKN